VGEFIISEKISMGNDLKVPILFQEPSKALGAPRPRREFVEGTAFVYEPREKSLEHRLKKSMRQSINPEPKDGSSLFSIVETLGSPEKRVSLPPKNYLSYLLDS
jgi:hypothetical protein